MKIKKKTKLRIISGELKGRYITITDNISYRPTLERVRETVAEIVKQKVIDATVADVCAGSGAFGFEMISRGARHVDFVDIDKSAIINIADNARTLGVSEKVNIIRDDVSKFIERGNKYDVIFYDPPYDFENLANLISQLLTLLNDNGVLIYERRKLHGEKKNTVAQKPNMTNVRIFSDTVVEFYSP